ncbi:MT-A70 family methyltransferase [Mucilaginibacter sp.]|uniref:MT-A70 family methyltransferase n=1 Tax=Mucilaginibacter sp. TaxID=1882438 RepID=UPI003569AC2D
MKHNVIMACPPWKQYCIYRRSHTGLTDNISRNAFRAARTFEFLDACLRDMTSEEHYLFIWAKGKFAEECRVYMKRLGYHYRGYLMWYRARWKRGSSGKTLEYLMVYAKGDQQATEIELPDAINSPFTGLVSQKREKPEDVYKFIENLFPFSSKLQIFGFVNRSSWTSIHYNPKKILNL